MEAKVARVLRAIEEYTFSPSVSRGIHLGDLKLQNLA